MENFNESKNPKISLIITLYNQKNYISKIYSCIYHQSLKDIEIIFVDDDSKDNSSIIINELKKKDKRINYIKNLFNKGQFYSRNLGAFISKGEYILIIDPDDLLLSNILIKTYETAKFYDLDILQFYHMMGSYQNNYLFHMNLSISSILYPPKIKEVFFNTSDRYLWDKLIKRNIFIKSIIFMKKQFRNQRFYMHNDELACFGLFQVANSYGLLDEIGYFYNRFNPNSTTKEIYKLKYINKRFHTMFSIMKYYFEQSNNNLYEKVMGGYNFFQLRIFPRNFRLIKYITEGFDYIDDILNLYLKCPFFNDEQKNKLKKFKDKVNMRKMKIYKEK